MEHYVDFHGLDVGATLPPLHKPALTKHQLVRYAGASGEFNLLHTDDVTARQSGLPGVIAQGILVMGFAGQAVTSWAPKRYVKRFKARIVGMSFPGEALTVQAVLGCKAEEESALRIVCSISVQDQNGGMKLSGEFEVLIPKR